MMPRNQNWWQRQRSRSSLQMGVSYKKVIGLALSLTVPLSLFVMGFFYSCGPLIEQRLPGKCTPGNDSAGTAIEFTLDADGTTITSDATLYFCGRARHYIHSIRHRWINQQHAFETADSCRSTIVQRVLDFSKLPTIDEDHSNQRHPLERLRRFLSKHASNPSSTTIKSRTTTTTATTHALKEFPKAFTNPYDIVLTESQQALIGTLSQRVRDNIPKFVHRAAHVAWGGPGGPKWYFPVRGDHHRHQHHHQQQHRHPSKAPQTHSVLDTMDGGRLLYSYLRVLKWPDDLRIQVPAQLCGPNGCDAEFALAHTLEFREKFQPWHITPAAMHENRQGFIYHRGFSPSPSANTNNHPSFNNLNNNNKNNHHNNGKHALIWYRPGIHKREDSTAYLRAMMYTLEHAVADSLRTSGNKMGKFNVIIDTHGFSFAMVPRLWEVKLGIKILQDHLPDRLGMVFLVNLSHPAELALNLIRPFLNKEVRNKIRIVPQHDKTATTTTTATTTATKPWAMLTSVMETEYIPTWLGGTDDYQFDPDKYYPRHVRISNQQGLEYLQTMPYHAH